MKRRKLFGFIGGALVIPTAVMATPGKSRQIGHAVAHELHRCSGDYTNGHSWACDQATAIVRSML